MEEVCKICDKTFATRKALGGHMRVHFMFSSPKKTTLLVDKFKNFSNITTCQQQQLNTINNSDTELGKTHELRDYPNNTSRFARNNGVSCIQCGKSFPTNRSLWGHMKVHPKESSVKRPKIKHGDTRNTAFYGLNDSCFVSSEIREVEMAAECLIMISSGVKVRLGLVTETSDDGSDYFGGADDSEMSLSSGNLDRRDDTDCKVDARNERKVTFETSVGFVKKQKCLNESPVKLHYDYPSMESDTTQFTELGETGMDETVSEFLKSYSCKKSGVRPQNSGLERTCSKNARKTLTGLTAQDVSKVDQLNSRENGVVEIVRLNSSKSKEYKCPVCFKVFYSGQAMGGHKRSHYVKSKSKEETDGKQEIDEIDDLIDLNFPIAVEGTKADHLWLVETGNVHTNCQVKSLLYH